MQVSTAQKRDAAVLIEAALNTQVEDSASVSIVSQDEWLEQQDPELHVTATARTLLRLKQYHGSLIEVAGSVLIAQTTNSGTYKRSQLAYAVHIADYHGRTLT